LENRQIVGIQCTARVRPVNDRKCFMYHVCS